MKIDKKQKRLKAIKLRYVLFPAKCSCCKEEYRFEKMWQLYRYGINNTWHKHFYCQNCMHSAEEVLHEIDTDESIFGLAGIDDFHTFQKKDCTRIQKAAERFMKMNSQ